MIRIVFGIVLGAMLLIAPAEGATNDPSKVKARPRITGDVIPKFQVEDLTGNTKSFEELTRDKYVMIAFVPSEHLGQESLRAYFQTIRHYIEKLGYEIFVVSTMPDRKQRPLLYELKPKNLFFDRSRAAFISMGLADKNGSDLSVISGVFFVNPSGKILSQFTSSDNQLPVTGDALVLAARVGKQVDEKKHPTEGGESVSNTLLAPTALTDDPTDSKAPTDNSAYVAPDETVLTLLTTKDIGHPDSLWMQAGIGLTPYDARRDTWSPRWTPGFQFGRRFNHVGVFLNLALDQTFDFTQEVKRLDVLNFGFGLESVALYGRIRSSFSAGASVLNSDTDIDSRGKIGWYFDLRPISVRWGAGRHGVFEFTPLGLNVSVPVTRGIPLILVGYMTTLSFELAMPVPQ